MVRTVTPSSLLSKDIGGSSSIRTMMTQNILVVEMWIIWKPHVVDGGGHHILENHNGLKYLILAASILIDSALPLDMLK